MVHWYSSVYCLFELCYISSVKWAYVITRYETLKILWLSLFIMSTTCYTHFIHHAMLFQYHTLHVSYQIHSHIHTYFIHNHIAYFLFWIVISYVYSSSYYAYTLYIHLLHGYLSYTFPISQHIPHTMYTFQYNASDIYMTIFTTSYLIPIIYIHWISVWFISNILCLTCIQITLVIGASLGLQ